MCTCVVVGVWGGGCSRPVPGWGIKEGREGKVALEDQTLLSPDSSPDQATLKGSKFQGLAKRPYISRQVCWWLKTLQFKQIPPSLLTWKGRKGLVINTQRVLLRSEVSQRGPSGACS